MKDQKQTYKPVHLAPEYHQKLAIYAVVKGISKKKAVEDMIDAELSKQTNKNKEEILCLN